MSLLSLLTPPREKRDPPEGQPPAFILKDPLLPESRDTTTLEIFRNKETRHLVAILARALHQKSEEVWVLYRYLNDPAYLTCPSVEFHARFEQARLHFELM